MFEKQASFLGKWGWYILNGSFFWILGNFIYLLLVANSFLAENINELGTLVITGFFLIPFIFSPGTTAAFACIRKVVDGEQVSLRNYWKKYQENYQQSMQHGLFYIGLTFLLYAAYRYYGELHILGEIFTITLFLFLTVLYLFVLVYTSDRIQTFLDYWKISIRMLISHPMFMLFMGTELFFVLYFTSYSGALLLLGAPGLCIVIVNYFYSESVKSENRKLGIR